MSTLTYSHETVIGAETSAPDKPGASFWRRAFDAIIAGQQRRAEREVAAYLANHGGLLTDDMEREIMRRLSGSTRRSV